MSVHGPPMLFFETFKLFNFGLNVDLEIFKLFNFDLNEDPDPASKNIVNTDPQPLVMTP